MAVSSSFSIPSCVDPLNPSHKHRCSPRGYKTSIRQCFDSTQIQTEWRVVGLTPASRHFPRSPLTVTLPSGWRARLRWWQRRRVSFGHHGERSLSVCAQTALSSAWGVPWVRPAQTLTPVLASARPQHYVTHLTGWERVSRAKWSL